MISSIDETESMLDSLTTYGADISLVNGETTATLWTKRSGYEKGGLNVLRSVANRPIETMLHVAVFARGEARLQLLQNQVKSAQIAQVVSGQVGFPVDVTDPIFLHVREQRVRVVLVDLNCQALEECLRAIRVIRLAARNVTVFAIGDRHNRSMIDGSIRAGADEYLECNKVHEIIEALRLQLWLINTRGKRVPGRAQVGVRPMPLRGSPPSGGSTPPMAPVFAPINRGPRPMRPRAVALAM